MGFYDLGLLVYSGIDLGFPSVNLCVGVLAAISVRSLKISKKIFFLSCVLFLLIVWGVASPYFLGYQSFLYSVIAAKQFMYFLFMWYVIVKKSHIDEMVILRFAKWLGVYLAVVSIFYAVLNIGPPFYSMMGGQDRVAYSGSLSIFRVYFPTYISLSIFIFYAEWSERRITGRSFLIWTVVLYCGVLLSGYLALSLTTALGIGILFSLDGHTRRQIIQNLIVRPFMIALIGVVVVFSSETLRSSVEQKMTSVLAGTDVALTSRDRYNEFRWRAIDERPLLGYGFLHKSSTLTADIGMNANNRFMESLGVIDSGYVDLLTRFGYLGTTVYLAAFGLFLLRIFKAGAKDNVLTFAMAIFLFQYYAINYTWSVFSYAHGIIPMSLALFLILSCREKKSAEQKFSELSRSTS
ncbi:O-antigen ligase family protein [Halioglobus sp. Uisw_031]|uniref:O-antigen ligase family protein n=1 Tax=Halioglobus sp. Uisw_031 TaxID=3230977 RepID=UPI0039EA7D8C